MLKKIITKQINQLCIFYRAILVYYIVVNHPKSQHNITPQPCHNHGNNNNNNTNNNNIIIILILQQYSDCTSYYQHIHSMFSV